MRRLARAVLKPPLRWTGAAFGRHRWPAGTSGSLLVLTYHRILPDGHPDRASEQPGMIVSPRTFDLHLRVLHRYFEFVDLAAWLDDAAARNVGGRRCCAITFDDGWQDNYEFGFPVLQEHAVPATFFLVTGRVGSHYEFWPNRLARLLAQGDVRSTAALAEGLRDRDIAIDTGARRRDPASIDQVIEDCKALSDAEMHAILDGVSATASDTGVRDLMNWSEIREMAATGLASFGSHTVNHTRLGQGTPESVVRSEVANSKREIEMALQTSCRLFCYPNGDRSAVADAAVRGDYAGAVTTRSGWCDGETDPFDIPRVGVHDDISATPAAFLSRIGGLT